MEVNTLAHDTWDLTNGRRGQELRPMSSAPRDGSYIIVVQHDDYHDVVSCEFEAWWLIADGGCLTDDSNLGSFFKGWLPLPENFTAAREIDINVNSRRCRIANVRPKAA